MQCIGIKGDVFHPTAVNAAGNLVGTPEVPLEHQLATTSDQHGMYVGIARGGEPISHPAQRSAIDELILRGDEPAVVSRDRNTAAVGRVRVYRQRGERCQRSSAEKRNKPAPSHSILSFTRCPPARGRPTG